MNQVDLKRNTDSLQLNERLWQAWRLKNLEMDRASAVKRWTILKVVAAIGVAAIIIQSQIR